jgi:hypothetical protein
MTEREEERRRRQKKIPPKSVVPPYLGIYLLHFRSSCPHSSGLPPFRSGIDSLGESRSKGSEILRGGGGLGYEVPSEKFYKSIKNI